MAVVIHPPYALEKYVLLYPWVMTIQLVEWHFLIQKQLINQYRQNFLHVPVK